MEQLDLFRERLPRKPYCTDELSAGLIIRGRDLALQHRYIQPNPPCLLVWLVFDVDRPGGLLAWQNGNLAAPHIGVMTPVNRHAHLLYGIEVPVCTSDAARQGPLRFLAAIQGAYTETLEADRHYAGLVCKNPFHPDWYIRCWARMLYDLAYMADFVDLSKYTPKHGSVRWGEHGLGRNCTLFARLGPEGKWAYRDIRRYWDGPRSAWDGRVLDKALEWNGDFPMPLPYSEVKATAKSVAKYTWIRLTPQGFRAYQVAQGRKGGIASGEARRVAVADRQDLARELRRQGKSLRDIAQELNIDPATALRWTR